MFCRIPERIGEYAKAEIGALGLSGLDYKRRRCDPDASDFVLSQFKTIPSFIDL